MRVLVTGGAGYIGAHTTRLLAARGDHVLVADDLVTGHAGRIAGLPILQVDLSSDRATELLADSMLEHSIDAVIHFAARKQVGESMLRPAWYHQQNVGGLANLLLAMERAAVGRLVFSSSAAVYGDADGAIDESHDTAPVNPYGATKLIGEQLITAATAAWELRAASLRYFNVGGAGAPELGDTEALNLIPIVFDRLASGEPPLIFGDDYDTVDGTCVRDYVHVTDVAEAHLAVLDALPEAAGNAVYNVGTGTGTSVRAMVDAITTTAGSDIPPVVVERRPGDAASVVAIVDKLARDTGWSARHSLEEIIASAWSSRQHLATVRGPAER